MIMSRSRSRAFDWKCIASPLMEVRFPLIRLFSPWILPPQVKFAVALLIGIGQELWGFFTPDNIEIGTVKTAASHYYAVPTHSHFIPMDAFFLTRGKHPRIISALFQRKISISEPARVVAVVAKLRQDFLNGRFKSQRVGVRSSLSTTFHQQSRTRIFAEVDHPVFVPLWTSLVRETTRSSAKLSTILHRGLCT